MKHSKLARLIASTNGPANRQAETEATQPRKLGKANKANSDTKAATAAFNKHAADDQHNGPHAATSDA